MTDLTMKTTFNILKSCFNHWFVALILMLLEQMPFLEAQIAKLTAKRNLIWFYRN
jgi:hypothetical protein